MDCDRVLLEEYMFVLFVWSLQNEQINATEYWFNYAMYTPAIPYTNFRIMWNLIYSTWIVWSPVFCSINLVLPVREIKPLLKENWAKYEFINVKRPLDSVKSLVLPAMFVLLF
jgi:hypothetical protein